MYPRVPGDLPERFRRPDPTPFSGPAKDMPGQVRASARLMYAGAALSTFTLLYWGFTTPLAAIPQIAHDPRFRHVADHANLGGVSVVLAVITAAVWLWMASSVLRGRNWARVVSAILLGMCTLQVLGRLPGQTGVVTIGWALSWVAGLGAVVLLFQRRSSIFFAPPGPTQGTARTRAIDHLR